MFQHAPAETPGKRKLFIVVSSDKGMCGGIHSSVAKATRRVFNEKDTELDLSSPIAVVGDKAKSQISRTLSKNLFMAFNQIGRDVPTFADAAGVADLILKSGVEYDSIAIVYNKFVSALSYESAIIEVETAEALKESGTPFPHNFCWTRFAESLTVPLFLQPDSGRMKWRMTLQRTLPSSRSQMRFTQSWSRATPAKSALGE